MRLSRAVWPTTVAAVLMLALIPGVPIPAVASSPYTSHLNVTYCTMTFASVTYNLPMNIYTPITSGKHPVVLWIPGGGWNTTGVPTITPGTLFAGLVTNLTSRGIAVASIGYQGFPNAPWPAQIEEAKCAVRFLRNLAVNNASTYSLNQYQIAAYGRSTGAHLVELMGLAGTSVGWDVGPWTQYASTIKAGIVVSGPTNLTQDATLSPGVAGKIDQVFGSSFANELAGSGIDYFTSPTPKFFLLYGINDTLIGYPQATLFQSYLTSKGASSALLLVNNAAHGLAAIPGTNEVPTIGQTDMDTINFLVASFKGTPPPTPTLTVSATPTTLGIGGPASASVTLSGSSAPTGTITFDAFSSCTGRSLAFTSTVTVSGNGVYSSPSFTPLSTGTYFWTASYSGDANDFPASTACGAAGSSVTVSSSGPFLSATATPTTIIFQEAASASATLSGENNPTGTITFHLYNAPGCSSSSLVFTNWATVNGNGVYISPSFTPVTTGTFYWTDSYSGDTNNSPISTTCGAPGSILTVQKWQPSIAVTVTPSSTIVGQKATASALLTGATIGATGSMTFNVFSTFNCAASSLVFSSAPITVNSDGTYLSGPFTPTSIGSYYWQASYTGDGFNLPATNTCSSPNSILKVSADSPSISLSVSSPALTFGQSETASVTLSNGTSLTGTVTLSAFSSSSCSSSSLAFLSTVTVNGNGIYTSSAFTPTTSGTYYWTASYSGDANNNPIGSSCGAAGSTTAFSSIAGVSSSTYADTPTNNDPTLGTGTVVFTFTITNYATETFTLGGTIAVTSSASVSCTGGNTAAISGSLAAGASTTFTVTCTYSGTTGQSITATLNATYTDPGGFQGTVAGSPASVTTTLQL